MSNSKQSSSWYRVSDLKPRLRDHIQIHRHDYRDQPWYILQDPNTGRSHRFNELTWFVITRMDGQRSLDEIWQATFDKFGERSPNQDALLKLLGNLHQADLLQTDALPNTAEMTQRTEQTRRQKLKQYLLNPLSMRFALFNPDAFLNRTHNLLRGLFSGRVFKLWLLLMAISLVLSVLNWPELVSATRLQAFSPMNLLLLVIIYPLIKLLHELGHAYAVKRWGGEVNEMGLVFLLFVPIPYVNANAATAFSDSRQRMAVSAAGIVVETTLASLALILWLNIESGLLSAICLNIMLIGGISTLLFNGNPLMKFDAYYILVDSIGIPNLVGRSKKYLGGLFNKLLFGIPMETTEQGDAAEKRWLVGYGIAAFIYRIFLLLFILDVIIDKFQTPGLILAGWIIAIQFILPTIKYFSRMTETSRTLQKRQRWYTVLAGFALTIMLTVFIVPMPQTSSTQGIIWLPEEMQVRAGTAGFIKQVLVKPNSLVQKGAPLIVTEDPLLISQTRILESRLRELQVDQTAKRYQHLESSDLKQEITQVKAELALQKQRLASLTLTSPATGKLILPNHTDLVGQYIRQGQILAFIMQADHLVTQVVIPETEISLYQANSSTVEIRPVAEPDKLMQARFKRALPEAIRHLPSAALGVKGGGPVMVDPDDPQGTRTMEKVFQVEFDLPSDTALHYLGSRVHVRISHGWRPLYQQWWRSLQQLFLRRLDV